MVGYEELCRSRIQNNTKLRNKLKHAYLRRCYVYIDNASLSGSLGDKGCSGLQIFSKQQMSFFELFSCCSYYVFRQQFDVKRVKCSATTYFAIIHFENNSNSSPGLLGQRFNNLHFHRTFDVIGSIWQKFSKFSQQQLVMMNYACDFSQSETEKYFE